MFENFRERLQTVQQDFTTGIKTLSDKSREAKISKKQRRGENFSQFTAGLELLGRYEDSWMTLHKRAKECTKAGEAVDGEVVMLAAHWEKRRSTLVQLQEQLQQMPTFLANLESITTLMAHLEADFEEMESRLLHLEDLCGQCEQQRLKQHHALQLENYKKKKRKELEALKADLDVEHAQKVLEMEHTQQVKLKERQKFFEEAFQQDMEQYLSTGYLQIAERREPIGSMSSMEVNVDVLEQMDLMDVSDQEALDVFLNSGLEDSSVTSPMQDPTAEALGADVTLQVPTRAELRHKLSSLSSSCSDSGSPGTEGPGEASDGTSSPAVQSDEEEVQADTLPESEAPPSSDDSDSAAS